MRTLQEMITFNHPVKGRMDINTMSIPSLISLYLMSSYAYYIRLDSLLPDEVFDEIANILLRNYEECRVFQESFYGRILIDEGDLRAGTLYRLKRKDYPDRVVVGVDMWLRDDWNRGLNEST